MRGRETNDVKVRCFRHTHFLRSHMSHRLNVNLTSGNVCVCVYVCVCVWRGGWVLLLFTQLCVSPQTMLDNEVNEEMEREARQEGMRESIVMRYMLLSMNLHAHAHAHT